MTLPISAFMNAFNWIKETSGSVVGTIVRKFTKSSNKDTSITTNPNQLGNSTDEHYQQKHASGRDCSADARLLQLGVAVDDKGSPPDQIATMLESRNASDVPDFPLTVQKMHSMFESLDAYAKMHKQSIESPFDFWHPIASKFYWHTAPSREKFMRQNLDTRLGPIEMSWMSDGMTNITFNCIDRHIQNGNGDRIAFFWMGNEPAHRLSFTYNDLLKEVCQVSNALVVNGAVPGDKIAIYMGMAPEALICMLAIARIGAVHVVIFGGYSSEALSQRLFDAKAKFLFAIDGSYRGSKLINLKKAAFNATEMCEKRGHHIDKLIIKAHLGRFNPTAAESLADKCPVPPTNSEFEWVDYDDFIAKCQASFEPVWCNSDDTLFILHTSGSTGTPKGIEHSHGGYMVYASTTFQYSFDIPGPPSSNEQKDAEPIFFCTGDVGWITGHTYNCYGPLLNQTTFVVFEGIPFYPDPSRYWMICDQLKVTHFYTSPTAIRACLAHGNMFADRFEMNSLRILGSVGEPINEAAWHWFNDVVGHKRCVVVDTYFQTETGGHVITNIPYLFPPKPGCAYLPFFGCEFALLDENGHEIKENERNGYLVMKQCAPGMMKGMFNRLKDFENVYFSKFPGYYATSDGARRDADGHYWITGRVDDVMNCSGHLLSSAEIEGLISTHPAVTECSVVGVPHPLKSETPYAFVVLKFETLTSAADNQKITRGDSSTGDLTSASEPVSAIKALGDANSFSSTTSSTITSWDSAATGMRSAQEGQGEHTKLRNELLLLIRSRIGPFAMPERIIFCSSLPKTRSGKIVRRLIRDISSGRTEFGDISALTHPGVIDELSSHFAQL